MKYDFDTPVQRRHTDAVKWSRMKDDELPMWVADMDFATAPEIMDALNRRLIRDGFGYTDITDEWYDAYIGWWKERHGLSMKKEHLFFASGVIAAIESAIRALTLPGERIVLQAPVYHVFYHIIENNGRKVVENRLLCEDGGYRMDLGALERQLADPKVTMLLLCNPHNPVGRIWQEAELAAIGEMAKRHHVIVVSDEIHCDLTEPGRMYVPFARVSDTCREVSITTIAPTKAFNLAGLMTSAVYVADDYLRGRVARQIAHENCCEVNVFSAIAATAAFTKGGEWLMQLNQYIAANRRAVTEYLQSKLPMIGVTPQDATYLMWLDVSALSDESDVVSKKLRQKTGLFLSAGKDFGSGGEHYLRMNIACPRSLLEDGLLRLKKGVDAYGTI